MKQNNNISAKASVTKIDHWAGPLPSPEALRSYNSVLPDAAERIMSMAESEMQHRHERESAILQQEKLLLERRWKLSLISIILGFLCVILLSGLIGFALYIGADGVALGTAIGAVAAVAGLFTYGQITKSKK